MELNVLALEMGYALAGYLKSDIYVYDGSYLPDVFMSNRLNHGFYKTEPNEEVGLILKYHSKGDKFILKKPYRGSVYYWDYFKLNEDEPGRYLESDPVSPLIWGDKHLDLFIEYNNERIPLDKSNFKYKLSLERQFLEKEQEKVRAWREAEEKEYLNVSIKERCRGRIYSALRRSSKTKSTLELLGVKHIDIVINHLESQFAAGMSWNNYGSKKGIKCWHIDHIRPCASFDLTCEKQQKECFNYTNLQPLWEFDNWSKGAKYNGVNYKGLNRF